jgi:hypothetical protein
MPRECREVLIPYDRQSFPTCGKVGYLRWEKTIGVIIDFLSNLKHTSGQNLLVLNTCQSYGMSYRCFLGRFLVFCAFLLLTVVVMDNSKDGAAAQGAGLV